MEVVPGSHRFQRGVESLGWIGLKEAETLSTPCVEIHPRPAPATLVPGYKPDLLPADELGHLQALTGEEALDTQRDAQRAEPEDTEADDTEVPERDKEQKSIVWAAWGRDNEAAENHQERQETDEEGEANQGSLEGVDGFAGTQRPLGDERGISSARWAKRQSRPAIWNDARPLCASVWLVLFA